MDFNKANKANFFGRLEPDFKEFRKLYKVKEEVNINYLIDDQLQETESNTGGLFQMYFYKKIFLPLSNSKTIKE